MNENDFDQIFPLGERNDAYAQYFIGQSYLAPLTTGGVPVSNVTFEPGCRNNWHIHHGTGGGDQILLCTAGSGWYQADGQAPISLEPGTVIQVPAAPSTGMEPKPIRGSPTSRSSPRGRISATNGSNP
ncbi:hypothetical protein [Jongsikchunia kroppenstedtii]|uniref:hypothetical protein n=1 Tax=Jongsikchunia kroppenstedtii TaxID=1121721 RepID=UPI00039C8BD1|nr:hypothetical protein [Jongsikchunia kroppenstedtii]